MNKIPGGQWKVLIFSLLLLSTTGCMRTYIPPTMPAPAVTDVSGARGTSTAIPTPSLISSREPSQARSSAKDEIVDFMVDYIVKNEIEAMIAFVKNTRPSPVEKPPAQFIIVFSPIPGPVGGDSSQWMNALDTKNAEKVWIYEDGTLSSPADAQAAIANYRTEYIQNAPSYPGIFMWGYDEFGIVSIADDGRSAQVYLADSCGSVCGHGILFTLGKNANGRWEIQDEESIWGS